VYRNIFYGTVISLALLLLGQGYPQAFVYPTYNRPPATFSSAPVYDTENKNF